MPTKTIRLAASAMLVLAAGCGRSPKTESTIRDAQSLYYKAVADDGGTDAGEVIDELSKAIQAGGLNPDQVADAHLKRGVAYARQGKADEALKDVEIGAQNSNELEVREARGQVFAILGKKTESEAEYKAAKLINPKFIPPPSN
ncbi:MAG: hypothetical protein ACRDD1_08775 [Planctomycetia bacterium]